MVVCQHLVEKVGGPAAARQCQQSLLQQHVKETEMADQEGQLSLVALLASGGKT